MVQPKPAVASAAPHTLNCDVILEWPDTRTASLRPWR